MKLNKNSLIIMLLVGVLLLVIAIPTGSAEIQGKETYETEIEKRLETILTGMEGVGSVKVMVTFQEDDTVQGVAVIAEGGGNPVVVKNITEVVQALFDVESHKIKVIKAN